MSERKKSTTRSVWSGSGRAARMRVTRVAEVERAVQTWREGPTRVVAMLTITVRGRDCQRSPSWIHHRSAKRIHSLTSRARASSAALGRGEQIGQADPRA
jgi:hypothetical protein